MSWEAIGHAAAAVDRAASSTPLSETGEPSSELHAFLQQQQPAPRPPMSKSAHDAIFGRSASASSASCARSPIVAHEENPDDNLRFLEHLSLRDRRPPVADVNAAPTTAAGGNGNGNGRSQRMVSQDVSRSRVPRPHPSNDNVAQARAAAAHKAPTALMIMQRRHSNSADAKPKRGDDLGSSDRSGGSSSKERLPSHGSSSKGSSKGKSSSKGSSSKPRSVKSPPFDPNDPLGYNAAMDASAQRLRGQLAGGHNPRSQNDHLTAARYNASLRSTLGGYPTGVPTQLTHPSVTMELIARDRARWESDHYCGIDYGHDNFGASRGDVGKGVGAATQGGSMSHLGVPPPQVGIRDFELYQELYQLRMVQQHQLLQQHQQHQQHQHQQKVHAHILPRTGVPLPASPPRSDVAVPPHSRRVYQERDFQTDHVWQEDDHSQVSGAADVASEGHEGRMPGKVRNQESDGAGEDVETLLPSVPELPGGGRSATAQGQGIQATGQSGGQPGHPESQLGQKTPILNQGSAPKEMHHGPQVLPTIEHLRQRGQPPPVYPQARVPLSIDEYDIYAHGMPHCYQPPTSTPALPVVSNNPRVVHHMGVAPRGPAIFPNSTFFHPQLGLIYPPTPGGSIASLPHPHPQLPGFYPQYNPHQERAWLDPVQQAQLATAHLQVQTSGDVTSNKAGHTMSDCTDSNAPIKATALSTPFQQTQNDNPPNTKPKKQVSFSHLQIRTYETILGDNPSCSGGPSLGLGWRYDPRHHTATVEEYEAQKAKLNGLPEGATYTCKPEDLVLHRFEREAILLNTGYTRQDLADNVRTSKRAKNRRRRTVHNLPVAFVEERAEVVRRTLRRWMRRGERTRHMYDEWRKRVSVENSLHSR